MLSFSGGIDWRWGDAKELCGVLIRFLGFSRIIYSVEAIVCYLFLSFNRSLEDMAKLLAYVTIGSSNVRLRTALGKTSWILVPFPSEWRWMDTGAESALPPGS